MGEDVSGVLSPQLPSRSPELLDVDMILQDDSTAADEQLKDADIDGESLILNAGGNDAKPDFLRLFSALLESSSEGDVSDWGKKEEEMEVDDGGDGSPRRSTSLQPDLPVTGQAGEPGVDCPICQRSYPMTEIEVHAAYCDGVETAPVSGRPEPDGHQGEKSWPLRDFYLPVFLLQPFSSLYKRR